jgi:hypothetical protein
VRWFAFLRCLVRSRHNPRRYHPLGGFCCRDCGHFGEDLDEMGFYGDGYVTPVRRLFVRPLPRARV